MPNLLDRVTRILTGTYEWQVHLLENVTGYRNYKEIADELNNILEIIQEPLYYHTGPLNDNDLLRAVTVYSRAGRPKLDFLVLGKKPPIPGLGYIDSTEDYPLADDDMQFNLGRLDEGDDVGGSILDSGNWTFLMNDLFVAGGIANRKPFYLASHRIQSTLWDPLWENITIYARELIGVFGAGYELHRLPDNSEVLMPPKGAAQLRLSTNLTALNFFMKPENLALLMHPDIFRFEFLPQTHHFFPVFRR